VSRMTAREIARRVGGRVVGDEGATADSWAFDSRTLERGACFVALRDNRDGHDFVASALDAGATVALVADTFAGVGALRPGQALVFAPEPLAALQEVARAFRADRADLHVVAVGGSTGKTSTKDLLAAALRSRGCYANEASYNNEFGLPITLCNTPESARVVVAEMGERFAGDLEKLCAIARPDTGVVTNAGLAHAEHLGGAAGVLAVLGELLNALPEDGIAVLSSDDPATPQLAAATGADVVTAGTSRSADYRIDRLVIDGDLRPSFLLGGQAFRVPLRGAHQATNAAMAIAVAHRVFGMPLDEIAVEVATATSGRWRMELLETPGGVTVLNDAYNANPASMEAALVALAHLARPAGARRVAVLGDMRELGAHHEDEHRLAGERAATLGIDVVVGVGAGGAEIARAAAAGGVEIDLAADAEHALEIVASRVNAGDAVLVKGSRALGLEHVAYGLVVPARPDTREGCRGGSAS